MWIEFCTENGLERYDIYKYSNKNVYYSFVQKEKNIVAKVCENISSFWKFVEFSVDIPNDYIPSYILFY